MAEVPLFAKIPEDEDEEEEVDLFVAEKILNETPSNDQPQEISSEPESATADSTPPSSSDESTPESSSDDSSLSVLNTLINQQPPQVIPPAISKPTVPATNLPTIASTVSTPATPSAPTTPSVPETIASIVTAPITIAARTFLGLTDIFLNAFKQISSTVFEDTDLVRLAAKYKAVYYSTGWIVVRVNGVSYLIELARNTKPRPTVSVGRVLRWQQVASGVGLGKEVQTLFDRYVKLFNTARFGDKYVVLGVDFIAIDHEYLEFKPGSYYAETNYKRNPMPKEHIEALQANPGVIGTLEGIFKDIIELSPFRVITPRVSPAAFKVYEESTKTPSESGNPSSSLPESSPPQLKLKVLPAYIYTKQQLKDLVNLKEKALGVLDDITLTYFEANTLFKLLVERADNASYVEAFTLADEAVVSNFLEVFRTKLLEITDQHKKAEDLYEKILEPKNFEDASSKNTELNDIHASIDINLAQIRYTKWPKALKSPDERSDDPERQQYIDAAKTYIIRMQAHFMEMEQILESEQTTFNTVSKNMDSEEIKQLMQIKDQLKFDIDETRAAISNSEMMYKNVKVMAPSTISSYVTYFQNVVALYNKSKKAEKQFARIVELDIKPEIKVITDVGTIQNLVQSGFDEINKISDMTKKFVVVFEKVYTDPDLNQIALGSVGNVLAYQATIEHHLDEARAGLNSLQDITIVSTMNKSALTNAERHINLAKMVLKKLLEDYEIEEETLTAKNNSPSSANISNQPESTKGGNAFICLEVDQTEVLYNLLDKLQEDIRAHVNKALEFEAFFNVNHFVGAEDKITAAQGKNYVEKQKSSYMNAYRTALQYVEDGFEELNEFGDIMKADDYITSAKEKLNEGDSLYNNVVEASALFFNRLRQREKTKYFMV